MNPQELQVKQLDEVLAYFGTRAEQLAAQGASHHAVRSALRDLACRAGIAALRADLSMGELRDGLLVVATGCGVPRAKAAVDRGLWLAGRRAAPE